MNHHTILMLKGGAMFGQPVFKQLDENGYLVLNSQHVISQSSFNYNIVDVSWFWCILVSELVLRLI